ncbi:MAG TPA: ROK family transcriptional regulator [Jatrophihabitantaceae bacterium]
MRPAPDGSARRDTLLAAGPPASLRLFTTLLTRGTMTRTELGARTGLSAGAITKGLRPLISAGLIRELPEQWTPTGAGRPALPLEVDAEHAFLVGVKITADEVIGVLTDLRANALHTQRLALPTLVDPDTHTHRVDPEDAINATARLVEQLSDTRDARGRISAVGVAVSGDVDAAAGLVRFAPLLGWRGISLADRLTAQTGLPTSVENDVRALTIAEQWFGAGLGCGSFALITLGTGVGCGLIVNGQPVTGSHGVAAEIGHLPVDRDGPECHCGGIGCVEALIGEAAVLDRVAAAAGMPVESLAEAIALADDPAVREVFADVGRTFGLAIAAVANLIGPERIVLSGESLDAYDLFAETMMSTFEAQCFGAAQQCELVVRPLQFEHWARGAAAVALARIVRAAQTG